MVRESDAFDPIAGSGAKPLLSRLIFFIPSLVSCKPIIRVYYHPHTFVLWLPPLPGTLFLLTKDREHLYAVYIYMDEIVNSSSSPFLISLSLHPSAKRVTIEETSHTDPS